MQHAAEIATSAVRRSAFYDGDAAVTEANVIRTHMEVVDVDGHHVGMVDALEGDRIKLTKSHDEGAHHYVLKALVQNIHGNTVTLTKTAEDAFTAGDTA